MDPSEGISGKHVKSWKCLQFLTLYIIVITSKTLYVLCASMYDCLFDSLGYTPSNISGKCSRYMQGQYPDLSKY